MITLVIIFSDDSQQTITKNLSSLLTGFNIDQHIVRSITAADVETSTEADFTCTIKDWVLVDNRLGTAN